MTCIVGVIEDGDVIMGCDSAKSTPYNTIISAGSKIRKSGSFLVGYSGSVRDGQILLSSLFKPPRQKDNQDALDYMVIDVMAHIRKIFKENGTGRTKDTQNEESDSHFLIGYSGRLFAVYSDFQVTERAGTFNAIGSGFEYALGSLYETEPEDYLTGREKVKRALKAAEKFDPYVQGPFKLLKLKGK